MAQANTTLTIAWQKVADAGEVFTLQAQGNAGALVQFKSAAPTDDVGHRLTNGQGLSNEYGVATDNCYCKLASAGNGLSGVVSVSK
jgi:hypothetical protein